MSRTTFDRMAACDAVDPGRGVVRGLQLAMGCVLHYMDAPCRSLCVVLQGQPVSLSVASSGDVIAGPPDRAASAAPAPSSTKGFAVDAEPAQELHKALRDLPGSNCRALAAQQGSAFLRVLQEGDFGPDVVGAKACNLARLRGKLPEWILVPRSVALPFGTFEAVLADPVNAEVAAELASLEVQLAAAAKQHAGGASSKNGGSTAGVSNGDGTASPVALLGRARELVEKQLKPPASMQQVGVMLQCHTVVCNAYCLAFGYFSPMDLPFGQVTLQHILTMAGCNTRL